MAGYLRMTPYNLARTAYPCTNAPTPAPGTLQTPRPGSWIWRVVLPDSRQPDSKAPLLLERLQPNPMGSGWSSPTNSNRFSKATTIAVSNHGSGAALSALTSSLFDFIASPYQSGHSTVCAGKHTLLCNCEHSLARLSERLDAMRIPAVICAVANNGNTLKEFVVVAIDASDTEVGRKSLQIWQPDPKSPGLLTNFRNSASVC